jgi:predicted transglutaminase-like cysteine proteinase
MGKGYIIAHKGAGLYDVRLTYAYRSRITDRLALYTVQIAELDIKIAAETDVNKKAILKLQRASIQKLYDYYSTKMPADPAVEAWCADLTEDLAYGTNVGTIEIPGEQVTVLVRPAYNGRSIYSAARDGMLMPAIAGSSHQVLFNWMLLPGWQRHKPIYRIGTIIDGTIDRDLHTCSVCLEPAYSSQQNLPAIDSTGISACGSTTPLGLSAATAMADYCSRYPSAGLCTNTEDGTPLELSDAQLADLQAVNDYVNNNYGRRTDFSGFRTGESWDEMTPGGSGDCEDFALTKAKRLIDNYGWSPRDLKIAVGFTENGEGHATLAVRTTNRGILILDNRNSTVTQHTRLSYKFDSIALQKDKWKTFTRQLDLVPIEYMNCNSAAFVSGDRVVVQFIDQKWETPKVIGFVENPEACGGTFYILCYFTNCWQPKVNFSFDIVTEAFQNLGDMPYPEMREYLAGVAIGDKILCISGYAWGCTGGGDNINLGKIGNNTQYDTSSYSFSEKQAIPTQRIGLFGASYGGKAYLIAGADFSGGFSGPHYEYDFNQLEGYDEQFVPSHCPPHQSNTYDPDVTFWNENEEFTLLTNSWASRQTAGFNKGIASGFTVGTDLYIAGGCDGITTVVYIAECWSQHGDYGLGTHMEITTEYASLSASTKKYSTVADSFSSCGNLNHNRAYHASASFDSKGFVFGGRTNINITSADLLYFRAGGRFPEPGALEQWASFSAEKFDPLSNAWSSVAHLPNNGGGDNYYLDYLPYAEGRPAASGFDGIYVHSHSNFYGHAPGGKAFHKYTPLTDSYLAVGSHQNLVDETWMIYGGSVGAII